MSKPKRKIKVMKAISLFSGMGGDSLAIQNCGIDLVPYSEISKKNQKTHEINFPDSKLIGDGKFLKIEDEFFKKNNIFIFNF